MDLLRFITAGSVDDGKSTLIGRLLYDSKSILVDQLEMLQQQSKNKAVGGVDLALLTDGLRAEREQGITIDVAYRYFNTANRKFIIADAPGHVQYTRNMITGASNVELIIVLIDARQGVVEQTRRHSIIASLLKIPKVVVAVNKMDLVDYSQQAFDAIVADYNAVAQKLNLTNVTYIPISALNGDNIVEKSLSLPWYKGNSLLTYLEQVETGFKYKEAAPARFQVQLVIRPQTAELHDYRAFAGRITSGAYSVGEDVIILPAGITTKIKTIEVAGFKTTKAVAGQSVSFQLQDDIDISRGDYIVKESELPQVSNEQELMLCWLGEHPLKVGNRYLLQQHTKIVKVIVKALHKKIDVNTLNELPAEGLVQLNEIVTVSVKTAAPLAFDAYQDLPENGNAILIDETSNSTVAAVLFQ